MERIIAFLLCCLLVSCAQVSSENKPLEKEPVLNLAEKPTLSGSFLDVDGNTVDLESFKGKPVVLMFSSLMCINCVEETQNLISSFGDREARSDWVQFITILTDSPDTGEWLRKFKDKQPKWLLGVDNLKTKELYHSFFPNDYSFPAVVILNGEESESFIGSSLYHDQGKSFVEYLQERVGTW